MRVQNQSKNYLWKNEEDFMEDLVSHHIHVDNYIRQGKVFKVLKSYQQRIKRGGNQG